jgi:hypothetical protein
MEVHEITDVDRLIVQRSDPDDLPRKTAVVCLLHKVNETCE